MQNFFPKSGPFALPVAVTVKNCSFPETTKMGKLAVIAIGGNSITKAGQRGTIAEQFENTRETASHIARMIARGYDVVITHGNGPQVGNILIQMEEASPRIPPLTLDVCVANTQGSMAFLLQRAILEGAGAA